MVCCGQVPRAVVGVLARGLLAVQLLACWSAMADRFDIVTFDAPLGWSRRAITDGLVFESPAADCQIVMTRSYGSASALNEDLDRAWPLLLERRTLIGEIDTPPQQDLGNGVTIAQRLAPVRAGGRNYITMLNLLRKGDRVVTVVVTLEPQAAGRCEAAIGNFFTGLNLDAVSNPPSPSAKPGVGSTEPVSPQSPKSDPQLAARFGNTVVGTWRYVFTTVQWGAAPVKSRLVIEIRFAGDGTYRIMQNGNGIVFTETGTYRVEGQRILMRPKQGGNGSRPYTLDWFFGDHPEHRGNWGLILRSSAEWIGGDKDDWRTFKPPE